jgi:hypothetical protein
VGSRLEAARRVLPFTTAAVILAAGYTAWVMYSRFSDARDAQQRAVVREAAKDRKIVDAYGGDKLTILSFAATAGVVQAGHRVGLCYGVTNATRVQIEPGVEPLRPALSHCTDAFPRKTTRFTLTAEDKTGHTVSASLTVRVDQP